MKITFIICQNKNTFTTRRNGGFIQRSKVLIPCHWGIVLFSSKHCPPCNDYIKKQEKNHTCLLTLTSTNNGSWHRVHLLHGGLGKILGGLLTILKVEEEASQVLNERRDPLLIVLRRKPPKMAFKNSFHIVTHGSFTADVGLLYPTGGVKTTPQMTRFRDAKVCNNLVTDEIDDHRIQSDYKCTIGPQNPKGKELNTSYCVCVVKPSDKTHDTNDKVTAKTQSIFHTAHMNFNTWIDARVIPCAHSPVVRFWSSWFAHHIVAQVVRVSHVFHACSERYSSTLSSPFHPTSSSSHSLSTSCSLSCISSTTLRAAVTLRTSPNKDKQNFLWTLGHRRSDWRARLHVRCEIMLLDVGRHWVCLACKGRQVKRRTGTGKGKGKGWSKRTGRAFFSDVQVQDLGGPKKGKKGLQKVLFRPYQPDKGAGKDSHQNNGRRNNQQGKGKEGAQFQSGFSASETPIEEGYAHTWESDDWSSSHWTDDSWTQDAVWCCTKISFCMDGSNSIESCQPSNTRCSGHWLHTVDWNEIGNRKIQEACMVLWHIDEILSL